MDTGYANHCCPGGRPTHSQATPSAPLNSLDLLTMDCLVTRVRRPSGDGWVTVCYPSTTAEEAREQSADCSDACARTLPALAAPVIPEGEAQPRLSEPSS